MILALPSKYFLVALSATFMLCDPAFAQTFPTRPVRFVVATLPGGGIDVVARIVAAKLQTNFKGGVIVENRPGADGIIGAEHVRKAAPDGHTLLSAHAGQMVMNPVVHEKLPYDPVRDFAPVSMLGLFPVVLVANDTLPATSVRELIGYARSHPGKLNYASGSAGFFFVTEALKQRAGADIVSIPYTGSAMAVSSLLAGTVHLAFVDFPPVMAHIKSGRLKALGVTTAQRVSFVPDIPAVAETLPGFEFVLWTGLFAPSGTPRSVIDILQRGIVQAVEAPDVREKLVAAGVVPAAGSSQALGDTVRKYLEMITALSRTAKPGFKAP